MYSTNVLSSRAAAIPSTWVRSGDAPVATVLIRASDLEVILPRVEKQITLTPYEKNVVRRLRKAVEDAKEQA